MELVLDPTDFWRPFLAVVFSFLVAQGCKMLLDLRAGKKTNLLENGGMPSSHAATVVGLMVVILFETGLSLLFLVTIFLAVIVMNDALGVRRETSRHSTFLNELVKKQRFRIVGHEPMEVFIGALIGLIIPIVFYAF